MAGFYAMQRGWMDNAVFGSAAREPFCRRAAWLWLVERAAWRATDARIEGQMVILARGELSVTIRDMGGQWGWPTTKVADFVRDLCENCLTRTKKIGKRLVITICNYEEFSSQDGLEISSARTSPEQIPYKNEADVRAVSEPLKETSKQEEEGSLRSPPASAKSAASPKAFDVWYAEYPHKLGRGAAEKAWPRALARASPEILLEGLRRYIESKPPDRAWCAPAVWLNQQRWLDQPAENDGRQLNGQRSQSPVHTLYEAAFRAGEKWDRGPASGSAGGPPPVPLLDRGRSG